MRSEEAALARELAEELGIEVIGAARPDALAAPLSPTVTVELSLWVVESYRGEPQALDGQRLKWVPRAQLGERGHPGGGPTVRGRTGTMAVAFLEPRRDFPWQRQSDLPEVQLDPAGLYREEIFTDRRAGTIRRLTPVTVAGATDPARPVLFSGQTQLLTPAGVLPLGFEIEASTLEEALAKFPEGVKAALEQAIDEAREMRREAASRIVVPEVGGRWASGPAGGGGKIKFP